MNMEMNGLFRKKNTVYDSVSFFVFIVGLLFVPLTVYPLLDFSLDISKRFLFLFTVGLAFIFWLIGRIASRNVSLPRHYAYVPLGGFLLSALISSLFSGQIRNAIVGFNFDTGTLVFLLALSLAFFLSSMFFHSTKKFLNFYFGLFFVFLIVFVFQVARYLFGNFTPWDIFDYGTTNMIGRWNEFGVFAGFIGLSALIFLEFLSLRGVKLAKVFMTVILILALMAVAVVNFYSVWIVLAVFSFLTYVYYLAFVLPSAGRRAGVLRPSLVVLIVALLFVFLGKAPNPYETPRSESKILASAVIKISEKLNISSLEVKPSLPGTYLVATEALKKDPLFGVGPNNFISSWMKHKPQSVNNTQFWNSDFNAGVGYVPTFFVTTGFVGGLLLSLFILSILYYGIKSLFYRKVESGDRSFLLLAFAGAVYLWIFAIIYVPDTVSLVLTFVVTGIFFSRLAESKIIPEIHYEMEANQNRQFVSAVSSASLILASTLLLYLVVVSAWALFDFQRSIYALRTDQNIDLAKRLISRSIALNPQDIYYRGAIEINMLEMNNLLKQKMPANELVQSFSKIFSVAKANADSAVKINRSNYVNYIVRGELYKNMLALKIDGAYEKAAENYEMALEYNPLNPAIHLEFAKLEILRENKKMADDHLKQAIALKSDYLDAIFLQSQLYSEQGNLPAAIKQIEEASLLAPNDVGVLFQLGFLKYKAGDFRGARDVLERTVSISPIYANARYFLGLSYDRLGLKDLAIIEFEAIQNTNPGNAEIVGILDNLKSGKPALAESIKPERSNNLPVKGE